MHEIDKRAERVDIAHENNADTRATQASNDGEPIESLIARLARLQVPTDGTNPAPTETPSIEELAARFTQLKIHDSGYTQARVEKAGHKFIASNRDFISLLRKYQQDAGARSLRHKQSRGNKKAAHHLLDLYDQNPSSPDLHKAIIKWAEEIVFDNLQFKINISGELYKLATDFLIYSDAIFYTDILQAVKDENSKLTEQVDDLSQFERLRNLTEMGVRKIDHLQTMQTVLKMQVAESQEKTRSANEEARALESNLNRLIDFAAKIMPFTGLFRQESSAPRIPKRLLQSAKDITDYDPHTAAKIEAKTGTVLRQTHRLESEETIVDLMDELDDLQDTLLEDQPHVAQIPVKPIEPTARFLERNRAAINEGKISVTENNNSAKLELVGYTKETTKAEGLYFIAGTHDFLKQLTAYQHRAGKRFFKNKQRRANRDAAGALLEFCEKHFDPKNPFAQPEKVPCKELFKIQKITLLWKEST